VLAGLLAILTAGVAWWAWEKIHRRTHPVPSGYRPEIALPFQREFELYHNALSLCSMKTRVCMAELGITYESHHIDLIETGCYENIRADFLAVNPGGTVPVLVHEGHPIYESHEQIRYAAEHAAPGSPELVPRDAALRAEMEYWIDRSSLTEDPLRQGDQSAGNAVPPLTVPIFASMIDRIAVWKILEGLLFHFDKMRPVLFLTLKLVGLRKLGRLAPLVAAISRGRRQMNVHLDALEEQLAKHGGPFILGEQISLADVSWLVIFERLAQLASIDAYLGDGQRPLCTAYWETLKARPSYRAAILDCSHPTIEHGTLRLVECKAADPALRDVLEVTPTG